ncbi:MAG: hypothetical protein ACM30I_12260 [Gemmatimonas sp.]
MEQRARANRGPAAHRCRTCAYFRNDPAYVESVMKGLATMSSGHASVRGDDGLCLRHDRYLAAEAVCEDYAAAVTPIPAR